MKNKKLKIILILSFMFIISTVSTVLIVNLTNKETNFSENSEDISGNFDEESDEESSEFGEKSEEEVSESSENSKSGETDEKPASDKNQPPLSATLDENQTKNQQSFVESQPIKTDNCTTSLGKLMLINPNFTVSTDFISTRKSQLVNITELYGIREGNSWNGVPLLDPEAAVNLNEMLNDYKSAYAGHEITTRSCFRSVGTNCGRLCYATGTSDHHSGYTCDLIDDYYGGSLDTDYLASHPEWVWLHQNSYKYGFIDRFIPEWAGGSMSEPVNVDENGTTGLYETWHYRYVGKTAAEEIALGKYNNGNYDSLEHYLKASGRVSNLLDKQSCN